MIPEASWVEWIQSARGWAGCYYMACWLQDEAMWDCWLRASWCKGWERVMWWRSCGHVKVGMCFECAAGELSLGCDMRWMWLIVLLLLRTLFRLPPGPFRSIHCLFVLLLINFTACAETYWEPKQLLYWWISLIRGRAPCQAWYFSPGLEEYCWTFSKSIYLNKSVAGVVL